MEMRIIYCDELELGGLDFELSSQARHQANIEFCGIEETAILFF